MEPNLFPRPGSYFGYIAFDQKEFKILTRLDVVKANATGPTRGTLMAFMKLIMGGELGHEYHTEVYTISDHTWTRPDFVFDANIPGNGPHISVLEGVVSSDGKSITGTIRSRRALNKGKIELVQADSFSEAAPQMEKMFPDRFVLPTATGEYRCLEDQKNLRAGIQLEAARVKGADSSSGHSLDAYRITGRIGFPKWNFLNPYYWISDGHYNFYEGIVRIPTVGLKCDIKKDGIDCQWPIGTSPKSCFFKRWSGPDTLDSTMLASVAEKDVPAKWRDSEASDGGLELPTTREKLTGEYAGFLFLADRKVHGKMSLEIALSGNPKSQANAGIDRENLSVYFKTILENGDEDPMLFSFAFQPLPVPPPQATDLTFTGPNDAVLQILQWNEKAIAGEWYSKIYGHVGNFLVKRGALTDLKSWPGVRGEHRLAGRYSTRNLEHRIFLAPNDSPGGATSFPFHIKGIAKLTAKYRIPHAITLGIFDPFTGALVMDIEAGRRWLGKVSPEGMKGVLTQAQDLGNPWIPHEVFTLRRTN